MNRKAIMAFSFLIEPMTMRMTPQRMTAPESSLPRGSI
jgi:hypothetical protein